MATYIQGIQDYIPQIQPFKPDFNFFQSALEQKQQQYQAGYNKISAMYGQLLNSELLRDANKERRDALFTEIDSDIKRLSGVDLSLQENVKEASKLFQPLISNDYFRKDLAFTKQYYAQVRRAEALQRSPDPKSDERFWQEGMTALHYQAEDFSKSSDDESMRYRNPLYTPKVDVTEKLFKFAKDHDINPEHLEYKGGYIFKYTNGVPAISDLQSTFSSILMSDPRIKAMTDTEAYLERKNYSKENATRFNGDESAAETEYLQNKITEINKYYAEANKRTQETAAKVNTSKKVIEDRIKTYGVDPDLDQDLVKMYQGAMTDQSVVASNDQKNKEVISQIDGIDMNALDRESLRYRVDNALSYFKLDGLASQTAQQYAMSKQKIDFKVDDYALAAIKHKYARIEQDDQQDHDEKMKLMDIVGNILKESGNAQAGNSLNPFYSEGIKLPIPGKGNVTLDNVDIQGQNQGVAQSKLNTNTNIVDSNINDFLEIQNNIIRNSDATPEQKAAAQQAVESKLGLYEVVDKQEAYTKTENTLTDWATGIGSALGTLTFVPQVGAVGAAITGFNLFGETTTNVPEQITKSRGLVTKNPDGSYALVDKSKRTHFTDPNSESYYNNVNKQVLDGLKETYSLYKGTPYEQLINQKIIDASKRQVKLDNNNKVVDGINRITAENNTLLSTAMANEAGTSAENAKLYWKPDMTGSRTENEFIAAYVEANKNNMNEYPPVAPWKYDVQTGKLGYTSEESRMEDMREDALDMYEDLVDAHETLLKNPDGNLNLKSVVAEGLSSEEGINRYYSTAAAYGFDAALWNTSAFSMAMDFFTKEFLPNTASPSFRDENGVKVVYGSGLDITRDEYAEMEHDPGAEMALKAFLASASMNYGGKTGENQQRPTGAYYLSAIAANDGNKVAMTWDLSPDWVKDHAGTKEAHGPTWDLQQKISKGGEEGAIQDYKITFFIDADKAKSMPFQAMQTTDEEMLMNMDGSITLDAFSKNAGNLTISKNALGGYNYSGYVKAMDELGNILNNPIFGSSDSDLSAMTKYFTDFYSQVAMSNMQQEAALRDPNKLQFDPSALLETE